MARIFDWCSADFGADNKNQIKSFAEYADDSKALYLLEFYRMIITMPARCVLMPWKLSGPITGQLFS